MKNTISLLVAICFIFLQTILTIASTTDNHLIQIQLDQIAVIDLGGGAVNLAVSSPTVAGDTPLEGLNQTTYLKYTSSLPSGQTRNITAAWGTGNLAPVGTTLKLEAVSIPSGCGNSVGVITVSNTAQNIITGLGACYTGTTTGATLKYTLSIDDAFSLIASENKNADITFVITDASQ